MTDKQQHWRQVNDAVKYRPMEVRIHAVEPDTIYYHLATTDKSRDPVAYRRTKQIARSFLVNNIPLAPLQQFIPGNYYVIETYASHLMANGRNAYGWIAGPKHVTSRQAKAVCKFRERVGALLNNDALRYFYIPSTVLNRLMDVPDNFIVYADVYADLTRDGFGPYIDQMFDKSVADQIDRMIKAVQREELRRKQDELANSMLDF